jgi:hypothetical protein
LKREFEAIPGYQNRYISISFLSQNNINLTEFTALSSVTKELVGATFKLSALKRRRLLLNEHALNPFGYSVIEA